MNATVRYVDCHTANVHKTDRLIGDRRGARNDEKLLETILRIYQKHPGRTDQVRIERHRYLADVGVDLPLSCF